MNNIVPITGGAIVIQACDTDWANVGIFLDRDHQRAAYHHVSVPDLARISDRQAKPTALQDEEYEEILRENSAVVLEMIAALNRDRSY